ncbi:MAG: efflux transporter periplasmic adaptor subunit [Phycisphaerales bacterium]
MKLSINKKYYYGAAVLVPAVILLSGYFFKTSRGNTDFSGPTYTVKEGQLTINFVESGTIKARDLIILKNEVEGRTSITYAVQEGSRVKKDELLIELDVSSLEDDKIDREIEVQRAEAEYISKKENLAVVENQAQSDVELAELTLDFAKQDLDKYIKGDYLNELHKAEATITLNKEKFERAKVTLMWSEKLAKENFISNTELQGDKLAKDEAEMNVQIAERDKILLEEYTYKRNLAKYQSDVNQAEMALERTQRKAHADVIQAEAELKAKEAEFGRQKDKLAKVETQISKTKIYAPEDGLVIYASSAKNTGGWRGSNSEPLDVGREVSEREELIYLTTGQSCDAEIMLHESYLKKIKIGMPTAISVDALQGKIFYGTIESIAPLPDARSMWMNPDLKLYTTKVRIYGEDAMLRSGMSCQADIIVEKHKQALYVPLQAVIRVGQEPTVFVKNGKSYEPRTVKVGMDNNKVIHIVEGLKNRDIVLLNPPLKSAAIYTKTDDEYGSGMMEQIDNGLKDVQSQPAVPLASQLNTQVSDQNHKSIVNDAPKDGDREKRSMERMQKMFQNMTPEQMAEMKKKFDAMTPEEKEKARKQFESGQMP